MANPNITFIPRGDSALSGFGILAAVILTTDATDANEYSVAFGKDPNSTSGRNVKTDKILFNNKVASGTNYTQEAYTYIAAINDNTGDNLIITAQLYKGGQNEGPPHHATYYLLQFRYPKPIFYNEC